MNKLLLFLLLLPFGVSAQIIQKNTTYGLAFNRTGADTLFYLPVDTFAVPTAYRTYNFMARKSTTLYIWNTSTFIWQAVSSGSGSFPGFVTDTLRASGSGGISFKTNSGVTSALFGAGGSLGWTFYGLPVYSANKASTYTSRSFTDKNYVDSVAALGWKTTGNSGTTAGINFIGTTDAVDVVLKANNTERARVLSTGNVGIGLSSPAFKLDVGGTSSVTDRKIGINGVQMMYLPDQAVFNKSFAIGTGLQQLTYVSGVDGYNNFTLGLGAGDSLRRGYVNMLGGINAGKGLKDGFYNVIIGENSTSVGGYVSETVSIGLNSNKVNKGSYMTVIGTTSFFNCDSCETSTGLGTQSALTIKAANQSNFIGYKTAYGSGSNPEVHFSNAMGYRALEDINYVNAATVIGQNGFGDLINGDYHTGVGAFVGRNWIGGRASTSLGAFAGVNALQKIDPIHQTTIGAYAYGTRDFETVLGSKDSTKYLWLYATDSTQANLVRTTSYNWVVGFDSVSKNMRYMPATTISTLATFGAGARLAGDTAAFTDSTIYGSFYNDGEDTLVITAMRIVMQGTNDTLTINVEWNDSLNTTGTKLKTAYAAANNNYTGNSYTSFDNTKIPPGNHVWCKSPTVIPGRRPNYLSVTLIGYKKRV